MKTMFFILSLFIITSCDNDSNESEFQPIEITPILISKGEIFNLTYNSTQHNEIFNNSTAWNNFVTNVWSIVAIPDEANVNFNEYQVIAVFDKIRPNLGHSIDIISITENEENITVVVDKLNNGGFIDTPSRPYHFVKIPISDKPIIFE